MPSLTAEEQNTFLDERGVLMRIGTVRADGRPLVTPIWSLHEDDAWRDLYRRIAGRYIDAEAAEAYIQTTIDEPRGLYRVRLAGARVRSWRMPVTGEDPTGIWHRRYYRTATDPQTKADS